MNETDHLFQYRKAVVAAKRLRDEQIQQEDNGSICFSPVLDHQAIKDTVAKRQQDLKIFGGGIALLSKALGNPILLYSPDVQHSFGINGEIKNYECLNTPYLDIKWPRGTNYFIDLLFFVSRATKHPEFIKSLRQAHKSRFEYPFQKELRQDYEFLHCSYGEILLFCLLWRTAFALAIQLGKPDETYSFKLFKELPAKAHNPNWEYALRDAPGDLVEKRLLEFLQNKFDGSTDTGKDIRKSVDKTLENLQATMILGTANEVLDHLGVLSSSKALGELNRFASYVFGKGECGTLTLENKEEWLQKVIRAFINSTIGKRVVSVGELLEAVHKTARFPILPYYFLMRLDEAKKPKEHIVFPLWYTFASGTGYTFDKNQRESSTLYGLYTIPPVWQLGISESVWYTQNGRNRGIAAPEFLNYIGRVYSFFSALSKPIVDEEYYARQRQLDVSGLEKQATRAAISQVMARNLSHNIGSHVLNELSSWDRIKDLNVKQFKSYITSAKRDIVLQEGATYGDKNFQIAAFNNYLKCRMDYLSDVTLGTPMMQTNKRIMGELWADLDKIRLLLEYISGLSSKNFKFSISFRYEGHPVAVSPTGEPKIAVPNDLLGCQAFYNIIENVVRNSAKHAIGKSSDPVEFTINFKSPTDTCDGELLPGLRRQLEEHLEVEIYDNINTSQRRYKGKTIHGDHRLNRQERDEYAKATGKTVRSVPFLDWLVYTQNKQLNESILIENRLRPSGLGLLEMEASAAYLRKINIEEIEDEQNYLIHFDDCVHNDKNVNILKSFAKPQTSPKNVAYRSLAYRFFVRKPAEFLFVTKYQPSEEDRNRLLSQGVWFRSPSELSAEVKSGAVYNHEFLISMDELPPDMKSRDYALPPRKLRIEDLNVRVLFTEQYEQLEKLIWQCWTDNLLKQFSLKGILIDLGDGPNPPEKDFFRISLLDHDFNWSRIFPTWSELAEEIKGRYFLEALPSRSKDRLPGPDNRAVWENYIANLNRDSVAKFKVFEAAITRIVVVDERIQRFVEGNYNNTPLAEIFVAAKVFVPNRSIPLDALNYGLNLTEQILDFIETHEGDHLVLHYGVLERMYSRNTSELREQLLRWSRKFRRVIITSGRGQPGTLKTLLRPNSAGDGNNIFFIHLSPVLNAFVENRSKYAMSYLINSARRI